MASRLKRYFDFLALERSIIGLIFVVLLVGLGEKLSERFIPLYLVALGSGTFVVGAYQALVNLLGAFYAWPAGLLADRFGAKKSLLWINLLSALGFALAALIPRWQTVLFGAFFFTAWSSVSLPATMKIIGRVLPAQKRTMGVTMHSLIRRVPMALGPLAGGLLIAAFGEVGGVRIGFGGALLMTLLACLVQERMIEEDAELEDAPPARLTFALSSIPPRLRPLLLSDILIRFCEQIPMAYMVIWCVQIISRPVTPFQFGILTAIEMATAVLVYIPVAWAADRGEKEPLVLATFFFFAAYPWKACGA